MKQSIHQLALDLERTVLEKSSGDKLRDIGELTAELLGDCKSTAAQMVQVILKHRNKAIREDKAGRKELGLCLQQRDCSRTLLTSLGELSWERDYYKSNADQTFHYLLDEAIGVRPYERVDDTVSAQLLNASAEMSYGKSAQIITGGAVSRQTVRNKLLKLTVPQMETPEPRTVRELHVYADEDHVALQRPGKERGKKNKMVPLVTVTEGVRPVCKRRHATIHPRHFVDENFQGEALWKEVGGYIQAAYDVSKIETIYLHGDGGGWIRHGLDEFVQVEHVMDRFHLCQRVRGLAKQFPKHKVWTTICHTLQNNDRPRADTFLQTLMAEADGKKQSEDIRRFGTYLFGFWEENRKALNRNIQGSCTEGQVSHVLSERFSRHPMGWSEKALGKLTQVRASVKNGRPICSADLKAQRMKQTYAMHAEEMMRKHLSEAKDWSLFEVEKPIFDGASGTQQRIRELGVNHGLLN